MFFEKLLFFCSLAIVLLLSACGTQHSTPTQTTVPNHASTQPSSDKTNQTTFGQSDIDKSNSGWKLKSSQVIHFADHDVVIAGISDKGTFPKQHAKVVVFQSDKNSSNWTVKTSQDILNTSNYPFYQFDSVSVIQSSSKKEAIAVASANCGGSTGYGESLVFTIDNKGVSTLKEKIDANSMTVEQQGNTILINGTEGRHTLSFKGEQFTDTKALPSDLSPNDSVKVYYQLDGAGDVVINGATTLNLKVGQTIAFIPADAETKDKFNKGTLGIYTNAVNNSSSVNTSDSDHIWQGNYYTFDRSETAQFLLITDEKAGSLPLFRSRIVAMSFCEPRSCIGRLSS